LLYWFTPLPPPWLLPHWTLLAMVRRKSSMFFCDCSALRWLPRNYAKNTSVVSGGGGDKCGSGCGSLWLMLFSPLPPALAPFPPVSVASYVARRVFVICIFQQQVMIKRSCSNCEWMKNYAVLNSLERTKSYNKTEAQ
jgi:hypothetical protein